jgi:hypothetical protein
MWLGRDLKSGTQALPPALNASIVRNVFVCDFDLLVHLGIDYRPRSSLVDNSSFSFQLHINWRFFLALFFFFFCFAFFFFGI